MNKIFKRVVSLFMALLLFLMQDLLVYAAIRNITLSVVNSDDMGTTIKATVTADSSTDLTDGATDVMYSVYRNGSPVTGFALPMMAQGPVKTSNGNLFERDYLASIYKPTFSNAKGNYSAVAQAVYDSTQIFSNSTLLFNNKDTSSIISVVSGSYHFLALDDSGSVWSWGVNTYGQLGNGERAYADYGAQKVIGLNDVISLAAVEYQSLALKSDGTVWGWGNNDYGQLGITNIPYSAIPVQIPGLSDIVAISAGLGQNLALKKDGTVWAWNLSGLRQLEGLNNIIAIANYCNSSLALKADGTVWAWGENQYGQLGYDKTVISRSNSPIIVPGLTDVISITAGGNYNIAIKKDGTVWAWGKNDVGQLGNGERKDFNYIPVQVSVLSDIFAVKTEFSGSNIALKKDGTIWVWGINDRGLLGKETSNLQLTPVMLQNINDVVDVDLNYNYGVAIIKDGLILSWGNQTMAGTVNYNSYYNKLYIPISEITLDKQSIELQVGKTVKIESHIEPAFATSKDLSWSSSDRNIADVLTDGSVTGAAPGKTVIRVASPSDPSIYKECVVNVLLSPTITHTIKGTITLPAGQSAPSGGLNITINAAKANEQLSKAAIINSVQAIPDFNLLYQMKSQEIQKVNAVLENTTISTTITIPTGSNTANYILSDIPADSDYVISYSINPETGYIPYGYYSTTGTRMSSYYASKVDLSTGNMSDINMQLYVARTISGTISLPEEDQPLGEDLEVITVASNIKENLISSTILLKGERTANYSIIVPLVENNTKYRLMYLTQPGKGYIFQSGYSKAGAIPLSKYSSDLDVNAGNCLDTNITLIKSRSISGMVMVPSDVTKDGGINVTVTAMNGDYSASTEVVLNKDGNFAEYVLEVPISIIPSMDVDVIAITSNGTQSMNDDFYSVTSKDLPIPGNKGKSDYKLRYSVSQNAGYIPTGYYNTSGIVLNSSSASNVNVEYRNAVNVDFYLEYIERSIKGKVMLPSNRVAPLNGLKVRVFAHNDSIDNSPYTDVVIPEGKNYTDYEIKVPEGNGYSLEYAFFKGLNHDDYVSNGIYNANGVPVGIDDAALIDVSNSDQSDKDIILSVGKSIQGSVYIPDGHENATDEMLLTVNAYNGTFYSAADIIIPKGGRSAAFSIYVPVGTGYLVWYSLNSVSNNFSNTGYYNDNGTTVYSSVATPVTITDLGSKVINIPLICTTRNISGELLLPDGSSTISYFLNVIPDLGEGYELKYIIKSGNADNRFAERGFYSTVGTSAKASDIKYVNVRNQDQKAINLPLAFGVYQISLNKSAADVKVNESTQIIATVKPDNASSNKVLWSTDNAAIADVDSSGKITGKAVGKAVITVTSESNPNVKSTCTVNVTAVQTQPGGSSTGGGGGFIAFAPPADLPDSQTVDKAVKAINEISSESAKIADIKGRNDKIIDIINSVMSDLVTNKVKAGFSVDNAASAVLDYKSMYEIINDAGIIAKTYESICNKIDNQSVNARIEKKIVIDVQADSNIKDIDIQMPCDLFSGLGDKGIGKLVINSTVASISAALDFINMNYKTLIFSISKNIENNHLVVDLKLKAIDGNGQVKEISYFDKDITISIPYELKEGEDKDNITVFYIDTNGNKINMSAKYLNDKVIFKTKHFSKFEINNNIVILNDIENHWSQNYVAAMASKGYISGKGNEIFDPEGNITRAEFVKLITTLMGVVDTSTSATFSDVNTSDWFYPYVASAVKAGIIDKTVNFNPNEAITREDMALIISRVLTTFYREKLPEDTDSILKKFEDQNLMFGDIRKAVAACIQYGIMSGKGLTFDPQGNATRAEAAKILYNIFYY